MPTNDEAELQALNQGLSALNLIDSAKHSAIKPKSLSKRNLVSTARQKLGNRRAGILPVCSRDDCATEVTRFTSQIASLVGVFQGLSSNRYEE